MSGYQVLQHDVLVEEVIKGSRFITRLLVADTAEKAKALLKERREIEPDATHHCWAYIVGNPNSTTLIGCSDDGEPAGTAGKPMLNILQHSGMGDLLAICTRYYGGTKLGTGGLARAYGGGVKLALEQAQATAKIEQSSISVELPYEHSKDFEHLLEQYSGDIKDTQYTDQVSYQITVPTKHRAELKHDLSIRFGDALIWNSTQ